MFVEEISNLQRCAPQKSQKNIGMEDKKFSQTLESVETANNFDSLFIKAGKEENIPASLLKAIAKVESGFNPNAVSQAGAQGLMQLMPETSRSLGVKNPFDPEENITGAAKYLRSLLDRYNGDVKLTLAAYNAGPGNVKKFQGIPPFPETKKYLEKVLGTVDQGKVQNTIDEPLAPSLKPREDISSMSYRLWVELYLIETLLAAKEKV